jgi:hypothetical protein
MCDVKTASLDGMALGSAAQGCSGTCSLIARKYTTWRLGRSIDRMPC